MNFTIDFKKKCVSPKYYSTIKYMSHALKGEKRRLFIKKICDINIYLGCLCAITCEQDYLIDKYIHGLIKYYFEPVKFYSKTLNRQVVKIRNNNNDITNYLSACSLIGHKKAIEWYVYNHDVDKSILLQLSSNIDENQFVELLLILSKSTKNIAKIRFLGSTKNLYLLKSDPRIKQILSLLWKGDMDAYVQLSYDTNNLGDIWPYYKENNYIYIEMLKKCKKTMLALNIINNFLGNDKKLFSILKNSQDGKEFLYLYYLNKIKNGEFLTNKDYNIIKDLPEPSDKIKNYFISFYKELFSGGYRKNIDYSKISDIIEKTYKKKLKHNISIEYSNNIDFSKIIEFTSNKYWKKIVRFYYISLFKVYVSFDELVRKLNYYYEIQFNEIITEFKEYPMWIKKNNANKYVFESMKTEKPVKILDKNITERSLVIIDDYDYINKIIIVKPYQGSLDKFKTIFA